MKSKQVGPLRISGIYAYCPNEDTRLIFRVGGSMRVGEDADIKPHKITIGSGSVSHVFESTEAEREGMAHAELFNGLRWNKGGVLPGYSNYLTESGVSPKVLLENKDGRNLQVRGEEGWIDCVGKPTAFDVVKWPKLHRYAPYPAEYKEYSFADDLLGLKVRLKGNRRVDRSMIIAQNKVGVVIYTASSVGESLVNYKELLDKYETYPQGLPAGNKVKEIPI